MLALIGGVAMGFIIMYVIVFVPSLIIGLIAGYFTSNKS